MKNNIMNSILITGCNRGIGYGLVKHLSENYEIQNIFATCRDLEKAPELAVLKRNKDNVHIIQADLKNESDLKKVAGEVSLKLGDEGLDVLVNNAGVSSKFTRLQFVKYNELIEHFQVNTIAPIMLTKALIPQLKRGRNKNSGNGVVINMSSILGSIQENNIGGFYPYRTSKAALNAATRSMSIDFRDEKITAVSLHPGWIKTDMGGPNAPLSVEKAVIDITKFIFNVSSEHSGLFFDFEHKSLSW